jgi:xylulokinase
VRTPAWLGVDVGTSSLKVLVVDAEGSSLAEQETALPLERATPQQAEADPAAWIRAVEDLVVPLSETYDVRSIGVTGQMHGTILVDESGVAVRPAVLWPDSRAEAMRPRWDALPPDALGRLGNPWSAGMTGPVLAWLAEHEPDAMARTERVALPKDFVREHLVPGSTATDPSDASGTLLWDAAHGSWSREASAIVPAHLLPKVRPSAEFVGTWHGAEVVVGGGDTPVSLLTLAQAVDGWQPGDVVVNLGTGAQVIDPRTGPPTGSGWSETHIYQGVLGEHYSMVAAQNGGLALSWAQKQLGLTWYELSMLSQQTPAGAGGVLFSPFVAAERGALSPTRSGPGWMTEHASGHPPTALAARSAAEAQAFLVRRAWELLDVDVRRVFVVGGGAREAWVRQLLADVLGTPVEHLPMRSASAAGAVILAGGPTLRQGRARSGAAEPRALPVLADAYQRWRSAMYPEPVEASGR